MSASLLASLPDRASGRRTFALIAGLLCLPFLVATGLWAGGWRPERQINHGEILLAEHLPIRRLSVHNFRKAGADTGVPTAPSAEGRWMLLLATPSECRDDCLAQLALARQVQVSLNKDMVRLARGLVGPSLGNTSAVAVRWPDLAMMPADRDAWTTLGGDALGGPRLFLVDPQGRLVLRYGATPDPKGLRRDVERLLKYSWNG